MKKNILFTSLFVVFLSLFLNADNNSVTNNSSDVIGLQKPVPVINYKKTYILNDEHTIILDASKSIPGLGKSITKYIWSQSKNNPFKICKCNFKNEPIIKFILREPGNYVYYLTINDGISSVPALINFEIINKYTIHSDFSAKDLYMEYLGNKIFQYIIFSPITKEYKFKILKNNNTVVKNDFKLKFFKDNFYLLTYNEATDEFSSKKKNYAYFVFDLKDYPEFKNKINSIAVSGSFNNWNNEKDMLLKKNDEKYQLYIPLENGIYYYKFVINKTNMIFDKKSNPSLRITDKNGNYNSGIYIKDKSEE